LVTPSDLRLSGSKHSREGGDYTHGFTERLRGVGLAGQSENPGGKNDEQGLGISWIGLHEQRPAFREALRLNLKGNGSYYTPFTP
jgi:hypothetical protein